MLSGFRLPSSKSWVPIQVAQKFSPHNCQHEKSWSQACISIEEYFFLNNSSISHLWCLQFSRPPLKTNLNSGTFVFFCQLSKQAQHFSIHCFGILRFSAEILDFFSTTDLSLKWSRQDQSLFGRTIKKEGRGGVGGRRRRPTGNEGRREAVAAETETEEDRDENRGSNFRRCSRRVESSTFSTDPWRSVFKKCFLLTNQDTLIFSILNIKQNQ